MPVGREGCLKTESLFRIIRRAQKDGYPQSLEIKIQDSRRALLTHKFGKSYKYWDVASLTKILVTTPLLMQIYESGRLDLDASTESLLLFLKGTSVGRIPVKRLLNHSSGLVDWRPFYEKLLKMPMSARREGLQSIFRREKVQVVKHCSYSDLDFILLGWIAEEKLGMSLDEAAWTYLWKPLGLKNTFFIRDGEKIRGTRAMYAPTEKHKFRGVIQGRVFDDNGWSVGGVSGHVGLFSTLEDVSRIALEYLRSSQGQQSPLWNTKTFRKFSTRAVSKKWGDWGLGFSIPSRPVSTGGRKISLDAFGHTGYTGTSLWIDRKRNTAVTILSNRTFPSRADERFKELRKNIHDAVWEMIDDA